MNARMHAHALRSSECVRARVRTDKYIYSIRTDKDRQTHARTHARTHTLSLSLTHTHTLASPESRKERIARRKRR